jgi:predicted permease
MVYLLPRTVLVIIAVAITWVVIRRLWPDADPMIFGVAGASWIFGGVAYFGYPSKLRRDIEQLERGLSID